MGIWGEKRMIQVNSQRQENIQPRNE